MIFIKQNFILYFLVLSYTLSLSIAIQCKVCQKGDLPCLFGIAGIRECDNDDDLCYSWFYRTETEVGVQRNCISITAPEYSLIKTMVDSTDNGCIKRILGLDCFSFCSTDLCN